jgi:transposase
MIRLKLTPEQRAALQEMRRDRTLKPAERDRVEMARLADAGWRVPQIAHHLGYCAATVRRVFVQFEQTGPRGLRHHKPGPAPDLPRREQVEAALRELLEQPRTWTAGQLAAALGERGIRLSTRQVRRYLTGPGLRARWRRTKRTLEHKADPARVAAARAELEMRKNALRPAS